MENSQKTNIADPTVKRNQAANHWRRGVIVGIVIMLVATGGYFAFRRTALASFTEMVIAPDKADAITYGKVLFGTRGCGGCHTLNESGATGNAAPNLDGIGSRHDRSYIQLVISNPSNARGTVCPTGPCQKGIMPVWENILDAAQIEALTAYLLQQK